MIEQKYKNYWLEEINMFKFLKRMLNRKDKKINPILEDYNKGIILQVNNEIDNKAFIESKRNEKW